MAIQILGLRDWTNQDGRTFKRESFFNKGWRFPSVQDLFSNLNSVIDTIPEADRFNLYFTVADCFEERIPGEKGRRLKEQWVIPFDIDDIQITSEEQCLEDAMRVARAATTALGVPLEEIGVIFSGHGVQLFILNDVPILSDDFFDQSREHYAAVARRIQAYLTDQGIKGTVDTSVWSGARLMRLPNTENRKPNKPTRVARILNGTLVARRYDIFEESGIERVEAQASVQDSALKNYPRPDSPAVCEGCEFLKHCKSNQNNISEPQWYASLSILSRLDKGRDLCHEYSSSHASYSHYETEIKIDQALAASGPRTCKNIETMWNGCKDCDHYGKVASPIMIKGPDYIASADFGFRERKASKESGKITPGVAAYEDLIKHFTATHQYRTFKEGNLVYIYTGKYWEPMHDLMLREWMNNLVYPPPSVTEMNEFLGRLKGRNAATLDWFSSYQSGLVNFNNCVLELKSLEMKPHSPEYGFFSALPFNYDANAKSPQWDAFVLQIMSQDAERATLLQEFAGYCLSGDDYWIHKAALLVGSGANGKSTFMEILAECAGKGFYSSVPIQDLRNPQSRYALVGKLFNYSEETSPRALNDSEIFKALVAGGEMEVKQLYVQPYRTHNRAKLIAAANEMPHSRDTSAGLMRRLIILEFKESFLDGREDPFIKKKLREELSGIINTVLRAYQAAKERGSLTNSKVADEALEDYRIGSDDVLRFVTDCVTVTKSENDFEINSELYSKYVQFCELNGDQPLNNIKFGIRFSKLTGTKSGMHRVSGKLVRAYSGIKLDKEF